MNDCGQRVDGTIRTYRGFYAAHSHDYSQTLSGLEGCLELELEGRVARVDEATGLVVPAGYQHSYCSNTDSRVWVVDMALYQELENPGAFPAAQFTVIVSRH